MSSAAGEPGRWKLTVSDERNVWAQASQQLTQPARSDPKSARLLKVPLPAGCMTKGAA